MTLVHRPEDRTVTAETTTDRNPYVFVVGCARSGTTLLQRMLDNHPMLAVANDTHFIPHAVERLPRREDPKLTADLVEWVRTYRRFYRMELNDDVVARAATMSSTYTEFVAALYSEYARVRGKPFAGEKTPDYVRYLARLHALFPWARTVHLIRDGRDVALSVLDWAHEGKGPGKLALWGDEPLAVCAMWWRWQVMTGRRDGAQLGSNHYHEVRYEALVAQPDDTLRGLAAFLGLPHAQEMLEFHVGKTTRGPGLSAKGAWLPPTAGLRNWQADMTASDQALFEALAGDLLEELGYQRSYSTFPADVRRRAARCLTWWKTAPHRRSQPSTASGPLAPAG
jgi:Sulfotransferase family